MSLLELKSRRKQSQREDGAAAASLATVILARDRVVRESSIASAKYAFSATTGLMKSEDISRCAHHSEILKA